MNFLNVVFLLLGAIQIIRDTFLAYFRPPPPPHLVTLARTHHNFNFIVNIAFCEI